ncbi:hypothetical protein EMPG_17571 [Blastomyces silverae]|uniref:Uncharacterized protein n=1 Tax=Blastomyces silverae TaxID=2060906 RepID=A0A0H1B7A5_9EURO|nr:hypothetical protein EMPG_17571 [Blastomyces silverae]
MVQLRFIPWVRAVYFDGKEERSHNPQGSVVDEDVEAVEVEVLKLFEVENIWSEAGGGSNGEV